MAWDWRLQEDACAGCGICADLCPHHAVHMPPDLALPQAIEGACGGCMICVEDCPFDALVVFWGEDGSIQEIVPTTTGKV